MLRGDWQTGQDFETARQGTLYWTLSLYIAPDDVAAAAGVTEVTLDHSHFAQLQSQHLPSQLLRNAIDPLFNDIADREVQGEVRELLLAADDLPDMPDADYGTRRVAADQLVRACEKLIFQMPDSVEWSTEGVSYRATPNGMADPRAVRFRRFWMAHNNGGLSYNLAFSHHYASLKTEGDKLGYDPSTFYFISLLQKLAAPKEFELSLDGFPPDMKRSVFEDNLGISPLDGLTVADQSGQATRFWPFVKARMLTDAARLFARLAAQTGITPAPDLEFRLIREEPFIEVPGLTVPRSRFMFMFDDERFFKRLMPFDPTTGEAMPRKLMVRGECYDAYQMKLVERVNAAKKEGGPVLLDQDYWQWVSTRPDYDDWIKGKDACLLPASGGRFADTDALARAMCDGTALLTVNAQGEPYDPPLPQHIPAFEVARRDCLDYLFLSGFNQNIIDFMNQDTSEILDSIDPIYPNSNEQSDERFFVRYANHRAMVSYVPKSRSLESGNDYIGTCPYAFLIHALALHNEFLAREHESKSMARIERIEWLVCDAAKRGAKSATLAELEKREVLDGNSDFDKAEIAINQAKMAEYRDFERFRYTNPFRYDTEHDVFMKLEELRGTSRKLSALKIAVASLEDHARDLRRRHQQMVDADASRRDKIISILLGLTGLFGLGQIAYWVGEKALGDSDHQPRALFFGWLQPSPQTGEIILSLTELSMALISIGMLAIFGWFLIRSRD